MALTTKDILEESGSVDIQHFSHSDIHKLMDQHELSEEARSIIERENLLPPSLLYRLHNTFPHHSILKRQSEPLFKGKSKYTGISGFREVCGTLEKNGITLTHIRERELFVEVYAFLATKHVLNTINWNDFENDPVFQLIIPQPNMIEPEVVKGYIDIEDPVERMNYVVAYRDKTNPHDGKQILNRPSFYSEDGEIEAVDGGQHKYPQCFLLFDKTTQGCYAYCTYCFRHAQVRGDEDMFIQDDVLQVQEYWRKHTEITDILITGGDAGYMPTKRLHQYLDPIIEDPTLMHIKTIRIASRAITYEPGVVVNPDYDGTLALFKKLIDNGIQVLWMGHFSTPKEMLNIHTIAAIRRLRNHGINVRSQSPIMNHISLFMDEQGVVDIDRSAQNWIDLAHILMMLGMQFHSIYCARPTGEHDYFTAPLRDINEIFSKIYRSLPSEGRPSRYITMTSSAGKISLLGEVEVNGEKAFALKFNEGRNIKWLDKVFLTKWDEKENTIEKLVPYDTETHFFEEELKEIETTLEDAFNASFKPEEKVLEPIEID